MEKLNPRVDLVFKKLFGVEENKDLLMSLINSVVGADDQVVDVTLLNPYNPKNFAKDKLSVLDIKAVGHQGKLFNIELQITDEADYDKRALYYWGKLYTEQLQEGDHYGQLSKAIGIHILHFNAILENKQYHNVFRLKEMNTGVEYFKDMELHTIELKKFAGWERDELSDFMSKIKTSLDRWVMFLARFDLLDKNKLPKPMNDTHVKKALNVIERMNMSSLEREIYEGHLKWLRMEMSGVKRGYERGQEDGKLEEKRDIALVSLKEGLSKETISKITGLSLEEIETLHKPITEKVE